MIRPARNGKKKHSIRYGMIIILRQMPVPDILYGSFKKAGFPLCKPSNLYRWARIAAFLLIPLVSIATAYVYVRLHTHDVRFVECIVPKGDQKEVTLPDGSVITLNSGSVFLYPTHFTGDTRSVYLSGEGHFKVAPDKKLPFVVETNHLDVCVLGTQFNVQAYPLDKRTITTLETGSVAVRKKNQTDCFVTLTQPATGV